MDSVNPVEKLLNEIDVIDQQIKEKGADFIFGCFTQAARDRITEQIKVLQLKKAALQEKMKLIQSFYNDYVDIKSGKKEKYVKNEKSYEYFNRVLKDYEFQYAPKQEMCSFCGKTKSTRTGIVFTFDPLTSDLDYICDYCHIDRTQTKTNMTYAKNTLQD